MRTRIDISMENCQDKNGRCLGNIGFRGIYRFLDDHRAMEVARFGLVPIATSGQLKASTGAAVVKALGNEKGHATHMGTAFC